MLALPIREALGSELPKVAIGLDDLALALLSSNQGHYAKVESLYKRALTIREKP